MLIGLHPSLRRTWNAQRQNICKYFGFTFFLCCVAYFSLFRTAYYNFDDEVRRFSYRLVDEGVHGRVLADFLINFFYDGLYFDASPVTQICALFLFTVTVFLVFFKITAKFPKSYVQCLYFLPALLSPYVFFILSFRFDSIFMGIAAIFAMLPFILYSRSCILYYIVASLLLVCSLSLYQPLHNIYLCVAAFLVMMKIVSKANFKTVFFYTLKLGIPYGMSLLLYIPVFLYAKRNANLRLTALDGTCEYVLQHAQVGGPASIISNLVKNIFQYFTLMISDLRGMHFGYFLTIITVVSFGLLCARMLKRWKTAHSTRMVLGWKAGLLVLCFGVWLISPFGVMLGLREPTWDGRVFVSVFVFVSCALALISRMTANYKVAYSIFTAGVGYMTISCFLLIGFMGNIFTAQNEYNLHYKSLLIEDMYTLKSKNHFTGIAAVNGIGQAPLTKKLYMQYPLLNRSHGSYGDMMGFIFYGALRYADLKFVYPFAFDPGVMTKENVLIDRSAYTIYKVNNDTCVVVFREPESFKRLDRWHLSRKELPSGAAYSY